MANVWQKAFNRIFWRNKDKGAPYTPLGESKLLPMDASIDEMDDRILVLNITKADQSDLLTCVASITFNETTGILTITLKNGSATTIDTGLAKLAVNFDYDEDPTSQHYQQIIMEMKDGTYKYIDLSALITQFEFTNTATISWVVGNDGTVQGSIVAGSIQSNHLSPTLQAQINGAQGYSEESEAWAVGQKNGQDVPSTDPRYHNNSKYYAQQAEASLSNTVRSFNSRTGAVTPAKGDYSIDKISPLNGAAVGQVPVVVNTGTSQAPVYEFAMGRVSGGGIGTCSSKQPMTNAYLVVPNAGFSVTTGCYLSVIFANNFYYDGFNDLRLAIGESVYDVQVNGASPVTGKNYVKAGDAGIFVYDGTYFQLIGTSGGGHVIVDQDGTSMPQEDAMQFLDSFLTDDSLNGRTVVENIKSVASADYSSETEDGMYLITDGEGAVIEPASYDKVEVTADGVKTWAQLITSIDYDSDKITTNSYIVAEGFVLTLTHFSNGYPVFTSVLGYFGVNVRTIFLHTGSYMEYVASNSYSTNNYSNNVPSNGTKLTLYYGNKKATVDLQTTANRCWYDSSKTVKQKLDEFENHTFGTGVDILSLTLPYTVPTDGYLAYTVKSGSSFGLYNLNQSQIVIPQHSSYNTGNITFLRKGMTISNLINASVFISLVFNPLV